MTFSSRQRKALKQLEIDCYASGSCEGRSSQETVCGKEKNTYQNHGRDAQSYWVCLQGEVFNARVALCLAPICESVYSQVLDMTCKLKEILKADCVLSILDASNIRNCVHNYLSFEEGSTKLKSIEKIIFFGPNKLTLPCYFQRKVVVQTLDLSDVAKDQGLKRQVWQDVKNHQL